MLRVVSAFAIMGVIIGLDITETSFAKSFVELQNSVIKRQLPQSWPGRFVLLASTYLICLFIAFPNFQVIGHLTTGLLDLGLREQILWRYVHGMGLSSTVLWSGKVLAYFPHNHLEFYLFPVGEIYRFFPYTQTLVTLWSFSNSDGPYQGRCVDYCRGN